MLELVLFLKNKEVEKIDNYSTMDNETAYTI